MGTLTARLEFHGDCKWLTQEICAGSECLRLRADDINTRFARTRRFSRRTTSLRGAQIRGVSRKVRTGFLSGRLFLLPMLDRLQSATASGLCTRSELRPRAPRINVWPEWPALTDSKRRARHRERGGDAIIQWSANPIALRVTLSICAIIVR